MSTGKPTEGQGAERRSTLADISWWAARLTGASIVLALMGTLVWALSLSGSWYLPVGGAVVGGAIGWKTPPPRSSQANATLTYVLRGAALGLAVMFLYHSGCTAGPQKLEGRERERLVQPSAGKSPQARLRHRGGTQTRVRSGTEGSVHYAG